MRNLKSHPRTGPQCISINTLGFRCGHNAIEYGKKCSFHSTQEEREAAFAAKEAALAAAREAAYNKKPSPVVEDFLASTDNAADFAKALLTSLEFCEYITEGLRTRTIPPTILLRLMDYADGWGKPADRVEHTGKNGEPISEIRRVIVHPREEIEVPSEQTEMHDEGLDVPMVPVQPKRMH